MGHLNVIFPLLANRVQVPG